MALHLIEPIAIWDGATSRGLCDLEGVAHFLVERWPQADRGTDRYNEATRQCIAALEGQVTVAEAREAVIAAARAAGILDEKSMTRTWPTKTKKRSRWGWL